MHLRVYAGHPHLTDIGDDDKSPGEDALVSGLCTFDHFSSDDDVQTARHATGRDLVGTLLNADFLPVGKLAVLQIQIPIVSIIAKGVGTKGRLCIFELLLDIGNSAGTEDTCEGAKEKLWSYFGRARYSTGNGEESTNAVGSKGTNEGYEWKMIKCDMKFAYLKPSRGCGGRGRVDEEVDGIVFTNEIQ